MKKFVIILLTTFTLSLLASAASATSGKYSGPKFQNHSCNVICRLKKKFKKKKAYKSNYFKGKKYYGKKSYGKRKCHKVPEIDAAGAAIALALAAGVVSIGRERRKKA